MQIVWFHLSLSYGKKYIAQFYRIPCANLIVIYIKIRTPKLFWQYLILKIENYPPHPERENESVELKGLRPLRLVPNYSLLREMASQIRSSWSLQSWLPNGLSPPHPTDGRAYNKTWWIIRFCNKISPCWFCCWRS